MTDLFPPLTRLGATPQMELLIAAGKAVATLQVEYGLAVERVYTGSFMTSLDMAGERGILGTSGEHASNELF